MRKIITILIFLFSIQSFIHTSLSAEECLVIASDPHSNPAVEKYTPLVRKVFKRAGICAKFVSYPVKRIQVNIIRGEVDGEFFRVNSYVTKISKHAVPIPTPVKRSYGYIVSLSSGTFRPKTLKDIKEGVIGLMHAHSWHDLLSKKIKRSRKALKYSSLVQMLKESVVDGVLLEKTALEGIIEKGLLQRKDIHVSDPVIDLSGYILIHRKHIKLIENLDPALKHVLAEARNK